MRRVSVIAVLFVLGTSIMAQRLRLLPPDRTGITFSNVIVESDTFNVLADFYAYNGGGVGIGDIDGDGLQDIVFTSSQGGIAYYRNLGGLRFSNETKISGLYMPPDGSVYTGVLVADLTCDGLPDIYVGRRYHTNMLFVNNGKGAFTERSVDAGLAIRAFTTQSLAIDYDRDGDLDLYLVNSGEPRRQGYINPGVCDMLLQNNGSGVFTDVTQTAGIFDAGYGLSASMGDLNDDGWPDIFVTNDFEARDIIYVNNRDGTFTDTSAKAMANMSWASMGSDIADLNGDGFLDIISLDMLPRDHWRLQTQIGGMSIYGPFFDSLQRVHNALHINRGRLRFSNVCYLAGVAATDWSWSVLAADLDLDGANDLVITNGTKRDLGDQDYTYNLFAGRGEIRPDAYKNMPRSAHPGYVFKGANSLRFADVSAEWGFVHPNVGNGAAYADLDNDGDLDIVINTTDTVAFVFENHTISNGSGPSWIGVAIFETTSNPMSVGARVTAFGPRGKIVREIASSRGFHSTSDQRIVFAPDAIGGIDSVVVRWPRGQQTTYTGLEANSYNKLRFVDATAEPVEPETIVSLMEKLPRASIPFFHRENAYDDFKRERLLPNRYSKDGPGITVGDVNGDGREDVILTGAKYQPTQCFVRKADGSFEPWLCGIDDMPESEDVDALLLDVDGDKDLDLIVATGGHEFDDGDEELEDRLYLNNGKGLFTRVRNGLPAGNHSRSRIAAADIDGDGDLDVFIGGRVVPGQFPTIPVSTLYRNDKGTFVDITESAAPGLLRVGLTTHAIWADIDNDKDPDLVVVGEWMSPRIWRNTKGKFVEVTSALGLDSASGWWYSVAAADIDGDGDLDLVAGNVGLNCKYVPEPGKPLLCYADDYDENGSTDPIVTYMEDGRRYPTRGRMTLTQHIPALTRKFNTYAQYASASIEDVLTPEQMASSTILRVNTFASAVFLNNGGTFSMQPLPDIAQISPVMDIVVRDLNADKRPDIILAGNTRTADGDVIGYDAGFGLVLLNRGKGALQPLTMDESGFVAPYEVRRMAIIRGNGTSDLLCCTINDRSPRLFALPPVAPLSPVRRP